jgi:hypothetical protein
MSIPQNDMLGRHPLYDYQTNGTMMKDIVTTAHRKKRFCSIPKISLFLSKTIQGETFVFYALTLIRKAQSILIW